MVSAGYFLLAPILGGGMVRFLGGEGAGGWFSFGPLTWDSEVLLLLLIPLWALALRLVLLGGGRPFEVVFVFSVHYQVYFLLVVTGAGMLAAGVVRMGAPILAPPLLLLSLLVTFVYLFRALRGAFALPRLRLVVLTPALFLLHLGGGQALQNLL